MKSFLYSTYRVVLLSLLTISGFSDQSLCHKGYALICLRC